MTASAIRLRDVSKFYKLYNSPKDRLKEALHPLGRRYHSKFYALRGINLEIGKGEILGVVGRNGCGKSTLLKLISGVLTPNSGSVNVNGEISALLELGAGFNPEFTGLQNIYFLGTIIGLGKSEIEAKLEQIISFADIGRFINQPLKTYSSGMKARLGFAVAAHVNPDILVVDEVLAVGDALFKRKCYAKMEEFFDGHKTVIYVSHETDSVNRLCTRAIFLDAGEIILDSDAATVTKFYLRYLHANANNKAHIRREIKDIAAGAMQNVATPVIGATARRLTADSGTITDEGAFFIPDFTPKSTLEYRNKPIRIHDAMIVDAGSREVNALMYGEAYRCIVKFTSDHHETITNVAFGMQIKDQKGVKLSSIEANLSHREHFLLSELIPKQEVTVTFNFSCLFATGTYFINVGISHYPAGEQEVLSRVVDILCFRVIEPEYRIFGGMVNSFGEVVVQSGPETITADAVAK